MIELLTADTPNGKKISIMLEEIEFDYKVTKINILNNNDPLIIKKNTIGIKIIELINLLINSLLIKYYQSFSLLIYIFLLFCCNLFH